MPCVARNNCLALIIHPLHAAAAGGEDDDDDVGNENGSETVGATTIGPRGLPIDCVSIVLEYADATLLGAAASLSRDVSSTLRRGKYWRTLVRSKWGMLCDEEENDADGSGDPTGDPTGETPTARHRTLYKNIFRSYLAVQDESDLCQVRGVLGVDRDIARGLVARYGRVRSLSF